METPTLVVLAAGMGSRYGGLKQIDPVGPSGEVILDYSVFDAGKAGFEKVVFIIKKEIEETFKDVIGRRMEAAGVSVAYAFQELSKLPAGFSVPKDRVKPFGTSHALLCAKEYIHGPFAVINADDYYGPEAFRVLHAFLSAQPAADGKDHYAMVGYRVENTVTESGSVTRGVCQADKEGFLTGITETKGVEKTGEGARYPREDGSFAALPAGTLVSMNFWGFTPSFLAAIEAAFPAFLEENLPQNPLKCEYLLPASVDALIKSGAADVKVLQSGDRWYGVTYQEDKPAVMAALKQKQEAGLYPAPLWG